MPTNIRLETKVTFRADLERPRFRTEEDWIEGMTQRLEETLEKAVDDLGVGMKVEFKDWTWR